MSNLIISSVNDPRLEQRETKMIKFLARLCIVWVAIIFVASANEEILYGGQQLVEASNEAVSATTSGHAAFPPVERESRTAVNALNTGKKARLLTDESDDDLVAIGLGTRGAYPSYPSSFGQSSESGAISVLTKNPVHLENNHEHFKFRINDRRLFPSGVSLEQVNLQPSSSTTRRELLSDFDKTRETDASVSTEHYIPLPTSPPEILSESSNLGRKTQLQSDAPITQVLLGNSGTYKQDGGRGTKRKIWESWGQLLSLKTGVTSDENDAQHSYAAQKFLSSFRLEQPNKFSDEETRIADEENRIAIPQFSPQEIQQVMRLSPLGSKTPSYQNAGASMAPFLSPGGRIPREMSSMAGQNGANIQSSLKPPEQEKNEQSWRADHGTKSSSRSQPKKSLRAEKILSVDWPRSTEPLLNQNNFFQSGNQDSSSEKPPHVSTMLNPHQPETIMAINHFPFKIDGIRNYGRLKFNTDLFNGEGPYPLERSHVVELLKSIPRPSPGNSLFREDQLLVACVCLRSRHSIMLTPSMIHVGKFMGNFDRWYQYWITHANIDLKIFHHAKGVLRWGFVFPLFLLYVEMIISIIPFKQELPSSEELNYPQEMRNAINSYLEFNKLIKTPPENEESEIWWQEQRGFEQLLRHAKVRPSGIIWRFIEFWMKSHYTDVWNLVTEHTGLHACDYFKSFFNTIFAYGIETLNEKIQSCIPHL